MERHAPIAEEVITPLMCAIGNMDFLQDTCLTMEIQQQLA